jgi:hypothetical protein
MSQKNQSDVKNMIKEGYVPIKKGYKPSSGGTTGGHTPEKSKRKPVNPPKKK